MPTIQFVIICHNGLLNPRNGGIVKAMEHRSALRSDRQTLPRVLLAGYAPSLAASAARVLQAAGMEVEIAASVSEATYLIDRFHPDVVMAQVAHAAGFDPLPPLGKGGDVGVIAVLAADNESARVAALDGGADDVVAASVPPRELAARVRALHRRLGHGLAAEAAPQVGVDPAHRCLIGRQGARMPLSEAEFIALETLLDADGAPVSREWLGRLALKRLPHPEDRSVDQLVLKLRRKLAAVGASERAILSARRQGYVIADPSRFRSLAPLAAEPVRERVVGA